ncbi:hypothetical protein IQ03_05143 [Gemmobacter caeni]|uniref:Uncharacterized protein n=2 Tax=Gemmobacter caeni TaxID=589035 RepID=A0A2T6A7D2_9RHOB|nr:hypothetical protein C8N34_1371 [Gemmobacter caeni]TWI89856.1 hypothetical protein IQ03_05143 [Gemmobacter caeni]
MDAKRIKHLEFVTQAIDRMSQNSFVARGWCVTIVSALLAIAIERGEVALALLPILATSVFMAVDTFYLRQERRFRALYNEVRCRDEQEIDFSMQTQVTEPIRSTLKSPIIMLLYGGMVVFALAVAAWIAWSDSEFRRLKTEQETHHDPDA